jgi:hypothetical protein
MEGTMTDFGFTISDSDEPNRLQAVFADAGVGLHVSQLVQRVGGRRDAEGRTTHYVFPPEQEAAVCAAVADMIEAPVRAAAAEAARAAAAEARAADEKRAMAEATASLAASAHATLAGRAYAVRTPYHEEIVSLLRAVPGAKWNRDEKAWLVPSKAAVELSRAMPRITEISARLAEEAAAREEAARIEHQAARAARKAAAEAAKAPEAVAAAREERKALEAEAAEARAMAAAAERAAKAAEDLEMAEMTPAIEAAFGRAPQNLADARALAEIVPVLGAEWVELETRTLSGVGGNTVRVRTPDGREVDLLPYLKTETVRLSRSVNLVTTRCPRLPAGFVVRVSTHRNGKTHARDLDAAAPVIEAVQVEDTTAQVDAETTSPDHVAEPEVAAIVVPPAPAKRGRGRPPKGDLALTAVERNRAYRQAHRAQTLEVPGALADRLRALREARGATTADLLALALDALERQGAGAGTAA